MICSCCHQSKPEDEFGWRISGIKRRGTCLMCRRVSVNTSLNRPESKTRQKTLRKSRHLEKSAYIWNYLDSNQCPCGVADPLVLQFDHVRGVKSFTITNNLRGRSLDDLKLEIEKCDVICGNCHVAKTRGNFTSKRPSVARTRQLIKQYLLGHPCVDCGIGDINVLQFDHVRGIKSFTIACNCHKPWGDIAAEIAKCDIRCTNCHILRTIATHGCNGWYKYTKMIESRSGALA